MFTLLEKEVRIMMRNVFEGYKILTKEINYGTSFT